ncbi:MAG: hypothetical protein ABIV48_02585 [Pyrinomonadaceae bacterium]
MNFNLRISKSILSKKSVKRLLLLALVCSLFVCSTIFLANPVLGQIFFEGFTYWFTFPGFLTPISFSTFFQNCTPPNYGGCGGFFSPEENLDTKSVFDKGVKDITPDSASCCSPDQWELDTCWNAGGTYDWVSCFCGQSPIAIDVLGNGFNLTNAENGVVFDLNGDGVPDQISWSSAGSDDAWLALDRNGNGLIDNGKELFGDNTSQPVPTGTEKKNGFLALAVYDKSENGGNNDGKIDQADAIFASLRLWQDVNHNGISESDELHSLPDAGLKSIALDYKISKRHDEHGNAFRYRAKVKDTQDAQMGRWAWDVYLIRQTPKN